MIGGNFTRGRMESGNEKSLGLLRSPRGEARRR